MRVGVVTTLEEQDTIGDLVKGAFDHGCDSVIVIDAESQDRTAARARMAGAKVFTLVGGIGPALMDGWERALRLGADQVVQIDAGGSHDPAELQRFWTALDVGADVVIGSRYLPASQYVNGRLVRKVGSYVVAKACSAAAHKRVTDWTSGYRGFSRRALALLLGQQYRAEMHGWQIETLAFALKFKLRVKEVPITYIAGRSSFNLHVALEAYDAWMRIHSL